MSKSNLTLESQLWLLQTWNQTNAMKGGNERRKNENFAFELITETQ